MRIKMGHTSITCRHCGTLSAIDNDSLECIREYSCPACGMPMNGYELARIKMHYYLLFTQMCAESFGDLEKYENFDYHIHLWPHTE